MTYRRELSLAVLANGLLLLLPGALSAEEPREWVKKNLAPLVELYKEFHRQPELSQQETQTAARVAEELREAGFEVTENVGGTGVVGILKNGKGPTLMLRTDLDALPVTEQTGLDYASTVTVKDDRGTTVGVMHACGHDIHITNLIGTARYLGQHKDDWRGTLMLIGQPAEERGEGAKAMLEDGLFRRFPKPDYALAVHVDANLESGKVGYRAGYVLANVDSVDILIKGRGGHGAQPHSTIDPIVIAARLILDLQTIVSREIDPIQPSVVTVGAIQGGTKHNIIGDRCALQLTVRSYTDEVRAHLLAAIKRKALAAAASSGAPEPEVTVSEGTPALFNDKALAERIGAVLAKTVGEGKVVTSEPSMGGEDFSQYQRAGIPVLMYRLGSVNADRLAKFKEGGKLPPSLHSPIYYPDPEPTLATGVTTLSAAVLEIMKSKE